MHMNPANIQNAYSIVDTTLIPHPTFQRTVDRIGQCFSAMAASSDPVCLAIIGESRTGKSRALEQFELDHPIRRLNDGILAPFVRIRVPSKPTVKGLAEILLHKLGDPLYHKGTENAKTLRLIQLLNENQTIILALDEFQHFYDKTTRRVQHHVADWLKVLVDDSQIGLVVTGLPSCLSVIQQNEQLMGRFMAPVQMIRFDWLVEDQQDGFVGILSGMQEALNIFEMPDFESDEMAFRFYCATGGLIGYLTKILKQAVWNAADAGQRKIDLQDLAQAYLETVVADDKQLRSMPNPFLPEFQTNPDGTLLARVRAIGLPKPEDPPPSPRRKAPSPKISEVLSTK